MLALGDATGSKGGFRISPAEKVGFCTDSFGSPSGAS